ncbi:hypothetical protein BZL30_7569 [Mycobacterium kansasii]|uniref:PIN domain-containing protein n=1 Tax=Mycobacterium kansasii TaxID=1768 RepID=A0A1V3WLH1_MYCKA|nr:hypothetical protein BZL30_7569 [Mycobacterium kansasii]
MGTDPAAQWVMDTSTFTHFCRAGHSGVLERLAPQGIVLVPREVEVEIDKARNLHPGVPSVDSAAWAERIFMNDDEQWTALHVKVVLGAALVSTWASAPSSPVPNIVDWLQFSMNARQWNKRNCATYRSSIRCGWSRKLTPRSSTETKTRLSL